MKPVLAKLLGLAAAAMAVLGSARAAGEDLCLKACPEDLACEARVAECLLGAGRARESIDRLKPLVQQHPQAPTLARCLARAYLADHNPVWAQRTLQEAITNNPRDCESRSWLAWVHIGQGYLDLAQEVLLQPGCPGTEEEQTRWLLLRAFVARVEKNHAEARAVLRQVPDIGRIYPEDQGLWLSLRRLEDPAWIEPLKLQLEFSLGTTSNATAGSPTDPSKPGPKSALGQVEILGRFVPPLASSLRPALDASVRGHGLTADSADQFSYLELSARPGVIVGRDFPRVFLGYRAEVLLLNQEVDRRLYAGHRGELELETGAVYAFAGAGRRIFSEKGRTRTEMDAGLGGELMPLQRLRLLLAGSLRYYLAADDPYHQLGATGLAVAWVGLGSGCQARLGAGAGLDYYPRSGGEAGRATFGTVSKRFELFARLSAGLWGPAWLGARMGLTYDLSWRDSTADTDVADYDYLEHRLLVMTRWTFDLNPWAPADFRPAGHVALDYRVGEGAESGLVEERIQDLLRQDQLDRRGACGCK